MLGVSWGSAAMQTQDMDEVAMRRDAPDVKSILLECGMRFLEYLLEDSQGAAVPFRSGVLVNVPDPARFAVHKLVVSQRRPVAQQVKAKKDIQQANELLDVLLEDRPGDVWIALDAARIMPEKFQAQLSRGIERLPISAKGAVKNHFS